MKLLKSLLIVLIILANLVFAQPSFADKPKYAKNSDYIEVTKELDKLTSAKKSQGAEGSASEELQKKIEELEFQKYVLETGINWGQCRNETGKTLAVYGPQPNFDDDDDEEDYSYSNALYFLADGQATKDKWDCDGVYLPNDVKTTVTGSDGTSQAVTGPVAVKIGDGTQIVVKRNPVTGTVEFNLPPTKVFKPGELKWFIPNVSQAIIDTRIANAPAIKIADVSGLKARKDLEPTVVPNTPPQRQLQPSENSEIRPQPEESQPQIKFQRTLPKSGYYRKNEKS